LEVFTNELFSSKSIFPSSHEFHFEEVSVMTKKVLIAVTNNNKWGNTEKLVCRHCDLVTCKTGYWLGEVAHPYDVFIKNGYEVHFVR
jgi:hypothetical protein